MVLPPTKLLIIVLSLSLSGSFHFGYMMIVPNPAAVAFQNFHNESFFSHYKFYIYDTELLYMWPLHLNLMTIGGFFGSLLLNPMSEKLGRKRSFYIVAILQGFGSLTSAISYFLNSWELLTLGRLISGISMGISVGLQPMYFTEISPKSMAGFLNGMTGTALEFGFVVGAILSLPAVFGSRSLWHCIFWFQLLTVLPAFLVLPFIPESAKFILASKGGRANAEQSLKFFLHDNIPTVIKEIENELNTENEELGLLVIFKKPYLRRGLLVATMLTVACILSGIKAISFYSTYLFEKAGISPDLAPYGTVLIAFMTCLAAFASSNVVDRFGRKPLLLVSLLSLALLNAIFAIFSYVARTTGANWPGYVCVLDLVVFMLMFGSGPAVLYFIIPAELMPQKARSTSMSFVMALHWIVVGITNGVFYPLEGVVHEFSFLLFIIPLTTISIFLYFKLPETKNRTPLEIIELLGYRSDQISELELQ